MDRERSYIICLSQRGLHALQGIGVRLPGGEAEYLGTVMHRFNGKTSVGKAAGSISLERCARTQAGSAAAQCTLWLPCRPCACAGLAVIAGPACIRRQPCSANAWRTCCLGFPASARPPRQNARPPLHTRARLCRVELVQLLIDEARRLFPDSIRFHFERPCDGWDLAAREVHVASAHGQASKAGACSRPRG